MQLIEQLQVDVIEKRLWGRNGQGRQGWIVEFGLFWQPVGARVLRTGWQEWDVPRKQGNTSVVVVRAR